MATKDAKKKAANETANEQRVVARRTMPQHATAMLAYINAAWKSLGYPEDEKPAAMSRGMEMLYTWLSDHVAEIDRIRTALRITPVPQEVKTEIMLAKARAHDDPDPSSPLDMARRFNLPLVVVLYIANGEPQPDTAVESPASHGTIYTRPWRRSF
jgi:hypothetical protein